MKNSLTLLFVLIVATGCWAQDLIYLNNGDSLRVQVTQTKDWDVYYKQYNNPDGPEYVLRGSEIHLIKYADGKTIDLFMQENNSDVQAAVAAKQAEQKTTTYHPTVYRDGNTYMVDGLPMNKTMFSSYLNETADPRWAMQFDNALKLGRNGWTMFGVGLGTEVVGMALCITGGFMGYAGGNNRLANGLIWGGVPLIIAGEGLTAAGVACVCVGYVRMHNTADAYGLYSRRSQPQAYFSINASQNGLGLALNF